MSIALQFREQLPPIVQDELDQLVAALQQSFQSGIFPLLLSDPTNPVDNTWWMSRLGTSPTRVVALKARIAGVTVTVASITI